MSAFVGCGELRAPQLCATPCYSNTHFWSNRNCTRFDPRLDVKDPPTWPAVEGGIKTLVRLCSVYLGETV